MWDFLEKFFDFFTVKWQRQFGELQTSQKQIKEIIMGIKEDFANFQANVQAKFDELNAALTEINSDITTLLAANANTPPEVLQGMQDIQAKLQGLVDAAKTDAALNDGAITPPDNPL
jgi:uncharacterized phage infection (PIP) family protein YhgE